MIPTPTDLHTAADRIDDAVNQLVNARDYATVDHGRSRLRRLGFWTPKVASAVADYLRHEAMWAEESGVDVDLQAAEVASAVMSRQPDRHPEPRHPDPDRADLDFAMNVARAAFGFTSGRHVARTSSTGRAIA